MAISAGRTKYYLELGRVLVLLLRDCATPPHETCVDRMACFANLRSDVRPSHVTMMVEGVLSLQ
jgi:hypothetical protein